MRRRRWQRDRSKEFSWRRAVARQPKSGLTIRGYCRRHGLSEPSFYAWRREIARRDREQAPKQKTAPAAPAGSAAVPGLAPRPSREAVPPPFVKLAIDAGAPTTPAIEVVLGEGRRLRVRPGFDANLLRQLLRLLEEPSEERSC